MRYVFHGLILSVMLLVSSCGGNLLPVSVPSGNDGYENVLNSTVALLKVTDDKVYGPICSGFFVSKKELVTAGHCVLESHMEVYVTPGGRLGLRLVFEDAENALGRDVHFTTYKLYHEWLGTPSEERPDHPDYLTATVLSIMSPEPQDNDAALLRLKKEQPLSKNWLPVRNWRNPPRVGEEAFSIGMPVRKTWMLTRGIISKIDIDTNNKVQVYHDSRIGPGSSGSPLVDKLGRVVGINVEITRGNILSIATPSSVIPTLWKLYQTRMEIEELDKQAE